MTLNRRLILDTGANIIPLLITLLTGILIWFSPHPQELNEQTWHMFAIFTATIVGIITRPLPLAPVVLMGMVTSVCTQTLSTTQVYLAYSKNSIWLIVCSFFLAQGLVKTGLAKRAAYFFVRLLGKRLLGLAYGLALSELFLAAIIPSLTARSGGIIYPIILALSDDFKSNYNPEAVKRTCGFLVFCAFQVAIICCGLFLTAMAANPLIVEAAADLDIHISWGLWALAGSVPGLFSLIIIPAFLYLVMKPEIKASPEAPKLAQKKLSEMGAPSLAEWITFCVLAVVLTLWIFGSSIGIDSTTAAILGLCLLLLSGVLTWKDCLAAETAWTTLIWLGGLVSLGTNLKNFGFFTWFSEQIVSMSLGWEWPVALAVISLSYFYSHYFFASLTPHVSSMYAAFLSAALVLGAPPLLSALLLAFFSNLFGGLTHYSSGPAPIFYGSGYVPLKQWWALGFLCSVVNLIIWATVGPFWWKSIGLY